MAGGFSFARSDWWASSWATFYVMGFLADRVADPATRDDITERIDNNIPMLDLRDAEQAPLVDLIADDIVRDLPPLADPAFQESFDELLAELVDCAREQQDYNRDPSGPTYYRIGPVPSRPFDLDRLMDNVFRDLEKYDFARIDVRYYTAEQRAALRSRLVDLADPRVSIAGDSAGGQDEP